MSHADFCAELPESQAKQEKRDGMAYAFLATVIEIQIIVQTCSSLSSAMVKDDCETLVRDIIHTIKGLQSILL